MSDESRTIAEVVPDVTGIDRTFDYLVPDDLIDLIDIGARVRVNLNGRRIGAWVIGLHTPGVQRPDEDSLELKPILKWSGVGPSAEVVELCRWAADRWCVTRLRPFLVSASAHAMVSRAAPSRRSKVNVEPFSPAAGELLGSGGGVLRLPPTADQLPAVLSAARLGPIVVVCPSVDASRVLAARLKRSGVSVALMPQEWQAARGGVDVTIGARSTAFAPCPNMAAAVVLDEHDDALQEERMPTWHAREVLAERCRRLGVPLLLVSPCPTVVGMHNRRTVAPPRDRERAGWPEVRVVDVGHEPPWKRSILSSDLIAAARDAGIRLACVIDTKGQARLLACKKCDMLVRCHECSSTMTESDDGRLVCAVCGVARPKVCSTCSSSKLARLRPGTTRLREELEKTANRPVARIDAEDFDFDDARFDVFVGTQAVLNRLHRIDVVAFLDFDRELLAPRFQAHEQAMALVAKAARLVGPRSRGGTILLQTTLGDHEVVRAAVHGDLSILADAESERRRALGLPPYSVLAVVEGLGAADCAMFLESLGDLTVSEHRGRFLIKASSHESLTAAWGRVPIALRHSVRIEVDPTSM